VDPIIIRTSLYLMQNQLPSS